MSAYYAGLFLGVGVLMVFLPVHLRALGLTASATGAVFAARTLVQTFSPPFFGYWADRLGSARLPLQVATAGSALCFLPMLFLTNPHAVGALLVCQALFGGAVVPLADSMTLTVLGPNPERYGRVRLSGSVSFGIGILTFSVALGGDVNGATMATAGAWSVPVICATAETAALIALGLPHVQRLKLEHPGGALSALAQPYLWILFVVGAVHWGAHAPYTVFFGVHLQDLGLSPLMVAVSLCAGIVVETTVMFHASRWLPVLPGVTGLRITVALAVVRWLVTAWSTSPWALVLAQATHGVTFGLFYVLLIQDVRQRVPEQARATGQAVMTAVVFGLGGIGGTLLAGATFDAGRGPAAFQASAALEGVALLLSLGLSSRWGRARAALTAAQ